ncbi:MAG TPA: ABC transporter substrate-binding protein, partial [Candidatus Binataceae bacterium]|nr:ABC transporter substrate-binding protein [Candidatus Binataceae bacterium]
AAGSAGGGWLVARGAAAGHPRSCERERGRGGALRAFAAAALWLVAASGGAGCRTAGAPAMPRFAPGAQVLHLAVQDDVPTLDPAAGYDTASWTFEQMIFDTLVRYSDGGVDLIPQIATSWDEAPDARVFTFHLRHDARFTNGRAVTAADFKYEIERVLNPATRSKGMEYFREIMGAAQFQAGHAREVSGIATPDPWTMVFHLDGPDPIFVQKLAMPFAAAVPREAVERWGEDFSSHAIGSGPFKLAQWVGGQRLVLVRNPDYFIKGLPRLDAVVEEIGASDDLQWLKFEAGEIDISRIPSAEFLYVMKTPRLRALTLHIVDIATEYLGMNCGMKPFDDVRVRRAFNYAIDKRKIIALLNGRGVVADGVLPPGLPGFNPNLKGYPYDPAKARLLLEEAGVRTDFSPTLWMRADRGEMMIGQSIQQDLALVGVQVELKPVAWAPLLEAIRQPDTVALVDLGWEADFSDPQNFLEVLLSRKQWGGNNDTFYYNPEVDALLAEAAPLTDQKRRYAFYNRAEELVVADAPWVFLYNPVAYVIRQSWVNGYVLNPMRPTRLERVWLSPHRRGTD